jgi:hypothetical protein
VVTGLAAGAGAGQETGWNVERDVKLLVAFLNTGSAVAGTELLADPVGWRMWAAERGLTTDADLDRARRVRDALRDAVGDPSGHGGGEGMGSPVRIELRGGAPVLAATDAVGAVLAAAARIAVLDQWDRVKICPAEDCGWAFFDRSRNRSRTWCSMRVCGNREKARNWRERARGGADGPLVLP